MLSDSIYLDLESRFIDLEFFLQENRLDIYISQLNAMVSVY